MRCATKVIQTYTNINLNTKIPKKEPKLTL